MALTQKSKERITNKAGTKNISSNKQQQKISSSSSGRSYTSPDPLNTTPSDKHPQESNFVPLSPGPLSKSKLSGGSIIRTRRQTQQLQQQQQQQEQQPKIEEQQIQHQKSIQDSFNPPTSLSMPMQKDSHDRDRERHDSSISSRQGRGPVNPVSVSSSIGTPSLSLQSRASDPWNDPGFRSTGRKSGARYGGGGYSRSSGHIDQSFSRYPNSGGMNASPTPLHYGYDPPRDMHPPIGSLTAELDLAAKEDDDVLNLDGGFPDPNPSGKNMSGGNSGKQMQGSGGPRDGGGGGSGGSRNSNDADDFRHGGQHQHSTTSSYQGYPPHSSGGSSHKYSHHHPQGTSQGNYPGMHHPQSGPYSHNYPPAHSGMQGGPIGHGYYQSHYHSSNPPHIGYQPTPQSSQSGGGGYPPSNYPGSGHRPGVGYLSSYSSHRGPSGGPQHPLDHNWTPDRKGPPPHYSSSHDNMRSNVPPPQDNSRPLPIDNNGPPTDGHGRQMQMEKKSDSPSRKRPMRDRRGDSGGPAGNWMDGVDDTDNTTPEKIGQSGNKNDSNLLDAFRSPLPPEKDTSKRFKRSPIFSGTDTPSGPGSFNFTMDTPGSHLDSQLNFSPMEPSLGNSFMMEETPGGSRLDHDHSMPNPFGDVDNPPGGGSGSGSGSGNNNPSNSYQSGNNHHRVVTRRPSSPLTHNDSQHARNLPHASPFSNFINQISPVPPSNPGLQTSPMDNRGADHHGPPSYERNRQDLFPPKNSGEYEMGGGNRGNPMNTGYNNPDRHMGGYNSSTPSDLRSKSTSSYNSNPSRERFRHNNNSGPIRLQIGNIGLQQKETRKGLDGINQVVRGPPMGHRPGPPRGSPPPSFPFGPDPSRNVPHRSDRHHPMLSDRPPEHDIYATPIPMSNISNRLPRPTPVSGGSHYSAYPPGGQGMIPGSAPRYYSMPIPGTTPIKGTPGKENEKGGERRSPCNCKRSRCLKLYCECFAAEKYCVGCNCLDCNNTPAFESIRNEAIKATRAKNPNAFKPRFAPKFRAGVNAASPGTGHNMGCRCKKSACLKKYCECFEAGVVCGEKCKCVECQNFIGSQALIDRRRKIKDHRGAEFAMRTADQAWKSRGSDKGGGNGGGGSGDLSRQPHPNQPPSAGRVNMGMSPSPMHHHTHTPGSARSISSQPFVPPHLMGRSGYASHPSHAFAKSPMENSGKDRGIQHGMQYSRSSTLSNPRTPAARAGFNPLSKKKERKRDSPEQYLPYFGPSNPQQTKATTLGVFSFLSNDDLANASLVSKLWTEISLDEELWQF